MNLETNCFEYQFRDNAWFSRLKGKKSWVEVTSYAGLELVALAHKQQQQAAAQARALEALRVALKYSEAWSRCPFCDTYAGFLPAYPDRDVQGNIIGHDSDCPWPAMRQAVDEAERAALRQAEEEGA